MKVHKKKKNCFNPLFHAMEWEMKGFLAGFIKYFRCFKAIWMNIDDLPRGNGIHTNFFFERKMEFLFSVILHMQMIHKFYLGMGPFIYHVSSFLGFWGSFPCTSRKHVFSIIENKQNLSSFNPSNIWMVPMYVCISRKFDIGVFSFMSIIAYIQLRRPKVAILEWSISFLLTMDLWPIPESSNL